MGSKKATCIFVLLSDNYNPYAKIFKDNAADVEIGVCFEWSRI